MHDLSRRPPGGRSGPKRSDVAPRPQRAMADEQYAGSAARFAAACHRCCCWLPRVNGAMATASCATSHRKLNSPAAAVLGVRWGVRLRVVPCWARTLACWHGRRTTWRQVQGGGYPGDGVDQRQAVSAHHQHRRRRVRSYHALCTCLAGAPRPPVPARRRRLCLRGRPSPSPCACAPWGSLANAGRGGGGTLRAPGVCTCAPPPTACCLGSCALWRACACRPVNIVTNAPNVGVDKRVASVLSVRVDQGGPWWCRVASSRCWRAPTRSPCPGLGCLQWNSSPQVACCSVLASASASVAVAVAMCHGVHVRGLARSVG